MEDVLSQANLPRLVSQGRVFMLTKKEMAEWKKHGGDKIMFEVGSGIGVGVSCQDKNGKWIDITDYDVW